MPLTSTSTFAEVVAAYKDNADYDVTDDLAKAQAFVKACRFLLLMLPEQTGKGSAMTRFNAKLIKEQMDSAVAFVSANSTTNAGNIHPSFANFRD